MIENGFEESMKGERLLQSKGRSCKNTKEWSIDTHNHPPMFGWCHFWDSG
jgi:hypothetical protein